MKILQLESENVKRLKAVDITPESDVIVISGKNGAGKTSVLDSIYYALKGDLPEKPIREGENRAVIKLDLGEYKIKKIITPNGARLEVTTAEGHFLKSPQKMLDDLLGKLTFDPLEFSRMKDKDQKELLLELLNLDFSGQDNKRKEIFDDRTIVGREVKKLEGQVTAFDSVSFKDLPEKPVEIKELTSKVEWLTLRIETITANANKFNELADREKALTAKIVELQKELKDNQEQQKVLIKSADLEERKSYIDQRNEVNELINNASQINERISQKKQYDEISKALEGKRCEYFDCTEEIQSIDAQKEEAIKSAQMPIEGLSFDESGVLFNSIPFNQLSSAEQLKVSLAMAMAMNPKIKVIRITDGSLLDSGNMEVIKEMAREKDYQVWIEKVDESGQVGLFIEEGELKEKVTA